MQAVRLILNGFDAGNLLGIAHRIGNGVLFVETELYLRCGLRFWLLVARLELHLGQEDRAFGQALVLIIGLMQLRNVVAGGLDPGHLLIQLKILKQLAIFYIVIFVLVLVGG